MLRRVWLTGLSLVLRRNSSCPFSSCSSIFIRSSPKTARELLYPPKPAPFWFPPHAGSHFPKAQTGILQRHLTFQLKLGFQMEYIIVYPWLTLDQEFIHQGILGNVQVALVINTLVDIQCQTRKAVCIKVQALARMHRSDILAVPAYGIMRQGLSMPLVAQPGLVTRIGKIPRNALIFYTSPRCS